MSAPMRFRKVGALGRGYDVGQVDAFIARALGGGVSSAEIRSVGFDLRLGGYQVSAVDAALDRLEDDALNAEREGDRRGLGERGFVRDVTAQAQVLRARLTRPHGDRFARGSMWERAYDVEQVDLLCDDIAEYFDGGTALSPDDLRSAVFATRRGARGYSERAVDRFVDRVVAVMGRVT
ncbi:MAG: DivIVA domain-containing protein [Angustibacter sp.]